jgi:maltose alpha-D-glucosyltransferase/alpha-amylase
MPKKETKTNLQPPYNFDQKWEELLDNKEFVKIFLSDVLEKYIIQQRWYGGKSSKLKYIELAEYFRIQQNDEVYYGLILEVDFEEAFFQHYFLPIAFVSDENFAKKDRILPISIKGQEGFIIDAINLEAFRKVVFQRILTALPKDTTRVQYNKSELFNNVVYESSRFMGLEQSNTSIVYNEKYVLKFFRRIYADRNPS